MQLGNWQLDSIDGGHIRLDGGVMFGVVPRTLWQSVVTPDRLNRVPCANRCVLARDGHHTVLIDTGYGGKHPKLDRRFYEMEDGEPLLRSLAGLGVAVEQVDTVVLSHLHFDHVCGATRLDEQGQRQLTFPCAQHFVGRIEWQEAMSGAPELDTAYPRHDIWPLYESGQLYVIEDGHEVVPGIRACLTGGHTRGHLAFRIDSKRQTALFLGDICPTVAHLRRMWHLAYDLYPMETRRIKPELLGQAADKGWWLLWYHDAQVAASRVVRDPNREFVPLDTQERL
jgi:glyoxylase-like metal-dependent hydrolase (beta-lactamase superfamily II)